LVRAHAPQLFHLTPSVSCARALSSIARSSRLKHRKRSIAVQPHRVGCRRSCLRSGARCASHRPGGRKGGPSRSIAGGSPARSMLRWLWLRLRPSRLALHEQNLVGERPPTSSASVIALGRHQRVEIQLSSAAKSQIRTAAVHSCRDIAKIPFRTLRMPVACKLPGPGPSSVGSPAQTHHGPSLASSWGPAARPLARNGRPLLVSDALFRRDAAVGSPVAS
jgi:hypothetical protein